MRYNLFLDDERKPSNVTWIDDSPINYQDKSLWTVVRTFKEFTDMISSNGLPKFISFDHDLADEHYPWNNKFGIPTYGSYKELTGYEAAKWLCEYCQEHGMSLPDWRVHSHNTIGKENIIKYLENFEGSCDIKANSTATELKTQSFAGANPATTTNLYGHKTTGIIQQVPETFPQAD